MMVVIVGGRRCLRMSCIARLRVLFVGRSLRKRQAVGFEKEERIHGVYPADNEKDAHVLPNQRSVGRAVGRRATAKQLSAGLPP